MIDRVLPNVGARIVVYGGSECQSWGDREILPLSDLQATFEHLDGGR